MQVYAPRFLFHHNKDLEWWTLKPPQRVTALGSCTDCVIALRSQMDRVIALRQISVTAVFYLEDSRKIHLWGVRARRSKDTKRRAPQGAGERESPLAPLFLCFSFPPGLLYVNWISQECCLFYLRSSLQYSDLLCSIFMGFSLPCLLATVILDSFSLFYLPNNRDAFQGPLDFIFQDIWL